jgi:hypothetical protein
MTREQKIEMLRRIEGGADMFNELNRGQVIVYADGKYCINGKEVTKKQLDNFTGAVVVFYSVPCEGSNFDKK